jgi:hypothetical protein
MSIPDYISPIIGYRVWKWEKTGLKSLCGAVEAQPVAGGEMQGFCCRRTHRWACGGCA